MAKGLWTRNGALAIPMDDRSRDFLFAQAEGKPFIAETRGARNPKQLRQWWALMDLCAEHLDKTSDGLSKAVKIALGHSHIITIPNTEYAHVQADSIAYESLAQEPFNNLHTAAINKLSEWMGTAPEDLRRRFNEITADKRYEGMMR